MQIEALENMKSNIQFDIDEKEIFNEIDEITKRLL